VIGAAALLAAAAVALPPVNAGFDYQIGGAYPLPPGVTVVSRDWRDKPAGDYAVCYVNAFQYQPEEPWPRSLVLWKFEDPGWPGEFAIDISTGHKRARAARFVERRLRRCAAKGFKAVEYDNLDSWTRYPRAPFNRTDSIAYAKRLVRRAHRHGLAAAQKNTVELNGPRLGFDFAIAEECARWRECGRYRRMYGPHVLAIEYRRKDFNRACRTIGGAVSVVLRDVDVTKPGTPGYRFDAC
jgi:glycosyl hydrolase family 114